jgi:hypothetical protein
VNPFELDPADFDAFLRNSEASSAILTSCLWIIQGFLAFSRESCIEYVRQSIDLFRELYNGAVTLKTDIANLMLLVARNVDFPISDGPEAFDLVQNNADWFVEFFDVYDMERAKGALENIWNLCNFAQTLGIMEERAFFDKLGQAGFRELLEEMSQDPPDGCLDLIEGILFAWDEAQVTG